MLLYTDYEEVGYASDFSGESDIEDENTGQKGTGSADGEQNSRMDTPTEGPHEKGEQQDAVAGPAEERTDRRAETEEMATNAGRRVNRDVNEEEGEEGDRKEKTVTVEREPSEGVSESIGAIECMIIN